MLPPQVKLVAVSKFHPAETVLEAYQAGQMFFGESRVQELLEKYDRLPKDIEWHFIGHLQTNKVKYIAPFIHLIESADSFKLLEEINKQAGLSKRKISVLLQIHIAQESHKFGFSPEEITEFLSKNSIKEIFPNLEFKGLMGMATFTDDESIILSEFGRLSELFIRLKSSSFSNDSSFKELSMGMSDDYLLAISKGSTIVRIGSKIFGSRE